MANTIENAVREAVRRAGSQARVAQDLGVSQQLVSVWVRRGWVSPERAREMEALYGVPRLSLVRRELAEALNPVVEFDDCTAASFSEEGRAR